MFPFELCTAFSKGKMKTPLYYFILYRTYDCLNHVFQCLHKEASNSKWQQSFTWKKEQILQIEGENCVFSLIPNSPILPKLRRHFVIPENKIQRKTLPVSFSLSASHCVLTRVFPLSLLLMTILPVFMFKKSCEKAFL